MKNKDAIKSPLSSCIRHDNQDVPADLNFPNFFLNFKMLTLIF